MFQAFWGIFNFRKIVPTQEMGEITSSNWFSDRLKWCPTTITALKQAEEKILSYLKHPYILKNIEISSSDEKSHWKIRTLIMNEQTQTMPLVMLHGLGAAIGLWILNLDILSDKRPLYACDLLGFGLSSRPSFSKNPAEVKEQYVRSIELWRQELGIEKFILLGHSMGGHLATAYAMKYPERVQHLILAEPWGFPEKTQALQTIQLLLWAKVLKTFVSFFNPLSGLRIAGPWGPRLIERMRPDILKKFSNVLEDSNDMANYIYHCNAQTPSGEVAFKSLSEGLGWAKEPMLPQITLLHEDVPISFIYGSGSWMDNRSGYLVKQMREKSQVAVHVIQGSGHHVNSDQPVIFNSIVQKICEEVDKYITIESEGNYILIDTKKNETLNITNVEQMAELSVN